jgi:hypothetical protein
MFKHNTYSVDSMPCGGLWRDEMHSIRPDCPDGGQRRPKGQCGDTFCNWDTFFPSSGRFFSENTMKKTKKSGLMGKMPGISSSRGIHHHHFHPLDRTPMVSFIGTNTTRFITPEPTTRHWTHHIHLLLQHLILE